MDSWTLASDQPSDHNVYLTNGYLSSAIPWSSGLVDQSASPCYLRGVYDDSGTDGIDRLALLPNWNEVRYGRPVTLRGYGRELDLRRGLLTTRLDLQEERGAVQIEQQLFASRADPHLAMIQLRLSPDFDGEIQLQRALAPDAAGVARAVRVASENGRSLLTVRTRKYEIEVATSLSFVGAGWAFRDSHSASTASSVASIELRKGETATLLQIARVSTNLETDDPEAAVLVGAAPDFQSALHAQVDAWAELWKTDIEIDGDPETQEFARAGLYYLWSTVHPGDHWSIAPMGLSSNGYNGHIFWDAELWMYPTLLVTQPDLARSCVAYRRNTIDAARERAATGGFRGARFPWESAFTGEEMTPYWAEPRELQIHITADVAIAQWWYYLTTQDLDWLRQHGYPVIRACAEFWASRVQYMPDNNRYEIHDVQCADEYAVGVNNDAFTNASARECLLIAGRAAQLVGEDASEEWGVIAERMYIPFDQERRLHIEFDGYHGQQTKQADVELLAYPLEYVTEAEQVSRDLDFYAGVIDPNGPAMSFSVYSILSAQIGRFEEAYEYLRRSYVPNTRPPFQSFSETPINNEFHFCTGVGGALQSILYGWTGLRLREGYFVLNPSLPSKWPALRLRGLFLTGRRIDIEIERDSLTVRVHTGDNHVQARAWMDAGTPRLLVRWDGEQRGPLHIEVGPATTSILTVVEPDRPSTLPEGGFRLRIHREDILLLDTVVLRLPMHVK
jgi:trehalose/maltose hydrolase-like predicted phosphorylase